ncbi:MAG: glycosyltransferase [Deltaproteobacteria bacterium]|nr:MAG: glycosyltransferase [Deltaproteobacteria bacterium]
MLTVPTERLEGAIEPSHSPRWEIVVVPSGVGTRAGTHEQRPRVAGKFLFVGSEKLYVRGVTYGAFRPDEKGNEYHDLGQIERDFARMASVGINTVRIPHTTPPRSLLDAALRHGLRVMAGLSAEQYVGFLIDRKGAPDIAALIRARVRGCAGHPALLCWALGNEIPASLVRWLGPRRTTRYLERLYRIVKEEDPDGLVTYVNYPTTEYLELPFLDLVCFNVYLESEDRLDAYLARLQNLVGDRPLIMGEIGLDSLRNGEEAQARALDGQIRTAFAGGCAGVFVFTWTDEWYRSGAEVDDWAFGLTRRDRQPKPALTAVREAFAEVPFPPGLRWPRISVVVCTHNGRRMIRECLEGLRRIEYPDYEVIVVDDGSTDGTATIVGEYQVRLIRTQHRGLSNARNTGLAAATGEIVAYLDDDAYPDPHWLTYLAAAFLATPHAGVGGPNIAPPGDGDIAECIANAPGNPVHVLLSDREAEHIPGCNMTFRKTCLEAIGGFDPQFRTAGDDVDVCWRLRQGGWTLGYHPTAMVWHHRRNSVRAYWRQQVGYGRAEAQLERKWPEKYNGTGHATWAGRIYGKGLLGSLRWRRRRIYHGIWGMAPFSSCTSPCPASSAACPSYPNAP